MDNSFRRLPYTHEELEALLDKISQGEVLKADDYEKLINVIGLDNISTFSGYYNDLEGTPSIPSRISDLLDDVGYETQDDVNRKISDAVENIMLHINMYENENELEYAKNTSLENQAESLKIYVDEEIYKAIRSLDLNRFIDKSALNQKADYKHTHMINDINSLQGKLDYLDHRLNQIDESHEKYNECHYRSTENKKDIDNIKNSLYSVSESVGEIRGELIGKSDNDHRHDSLYADVAFEHHHCNQSTLDLITEAMISKWTDGIFVTYHNGKDENGEYLVDAPERPIGNGELEGWSTEIKKDDDVAWMSHKIAPCINEGIWSRPIKITGKVLYNISKQFYLSDSNTELVGGDWIDTLVYDESLKDKSLWIRFKLDWKQPKETTFTEPFIEEVKTFIIESIKNNLDDMLVNYYNKNEIDDKFTNYSTTTEVNTAIDNKVNELRTDIDNKVNELRIDVSNTYQTKADMSNYSTTAQMSSAITNEVNTLATNVANTYQTKADMSNYSTTTQMNTSIDNKIGALRTDVSNTYQTKADMNSYSTTSQINEIIDSKISNLSGTSSDIYQTKAAMSDYSTTEQMNTAIDNKIGALRTDVSNTYQTKADMSNYISTTQMNTAIDTKISTFSSTISGTYQTQAAMSNYYNKTQVHSAIQNSADAVTASILDTVSKQSTGSVLIRDPDDNVIGALRRGTFGGGSIYITSLDATTGQSLSIAAQNQDGTYTTHLMVSGNDRVISTSSGNSTFRKGVVAGSIFTYNPVRFLKGGSSDSSNVDLMSYIYHFDNNDTFSIMGKNELALGLTVNDNYTFRIIRDTYATYGAKAQLSAELNMCNQNIVNAYMTSSLNAQSTSTYNLRNKSVEQFIYAPYSTVENELRHTCMEPVSTSEEFEYNVDGEYVSTGRYVCYCELPLFMSENIELNYHVNISKSSFGDYRILEKTPYYFILESDKDGFSFTYEVIAKRIEEPSANNAIVANDLIFIEPEADKDLTLD